MSKNSAENLIILNNNKNIDKIKIMLIDKSFIEINNIVLFNYNNNYSN